MSPWLSLWLLRSYGSHDQVVPRDHRIIAVPAQDGLDLVAAAANQLAAGVGRIVDEAAPVNPPAAIPDLDDIPLLELAIHRHDPDRKQGRLLGVERAQRALVDDQRALPTRRHGDAPPAGPAMLGPGQQRAQILTAERALEHIRLRAVGDQHRGPLV